MTAAGPAVIALGSNLGDREAIFAAALRDSATGSDRFTYRNFAVGTTYSKTEVIFVAVLGFLVLGDTVSVIAAIAIAAASSFSAPALGELE